MNGKIIELIGRRRRQILVHSYIYYKLDKNLIDDATWSKWAYELYSLQKAHPNESAAAPFKDEFQDFDWSTGSDLPMDEPWIAIVAESLIQYSMKG